jgi:hypothetical protein
VAQRTGPAARQTRRSPHAQTAASRQYRDGEQAAAATKIPPPELRTAGERATPLRRAVQALTPHERHVLPTPGPDALPVRRILQRRGRQSRRCGGRLGGFERVLPPGVRLA